MPKSLTVWTEHMLRMFEKQVLRRIFRLKREGSEGWLEKLHNVELHNLSAAPHIIKVIKTRRMKGVDHVAHMRNMRNAYKILARKPERKSPLKDLGVDGKLLEWILEK
jgi:hypothetical protein